MEAEAKTRTETALLIFNSILLSIGNCALPLLLRLYYIRGGKRIWLSSWLQTAGWPIILIPLLVAYMQRRHRAEGGTATKLFFMKHRVFLGSMVIGILTGIDDYLYAYAIARLPVSTSSLLSSTRLVFTAVFSFLLVNQKFTAYTINAVVLLTVGAVVLSFHKSSDMPEGESSKEYVLGIFMMIATMALYSLTLPLVELMYLKSKQKITNTLVMEIEVVKCFFATAFCTVGMIINNDFQVIPREAKDYELGKTKYYLVLAWIAIFSQFFFVGAIGVILYSSSLFSGCLLTFLLPVTELLAVIFYHEIFQVEKGISLFLSLWGFTSYLFGQMKRSRKENRMLTEAEVRDQTVNP